MKRITRRTSLLAGSTLALAMCLGTAMPAYAGSGTVTVNMLSSTGAGLAGGVVQYYWGPGWQTLGTTDGSGTVAGTVPGTTDIQIRYLNGTRKWVRVDPATTPTLTINTTLVTVKLETCGGTALIGAAKYYGNGGWTLIGNTPTTIELLPYSNLGPGQGSYDFLVAYGGRTSATIRQDISVKPVVVFKTTKVTLWPSGGNTYYNGGWTPLINGTELIGGTFNGVSSTAEVRCGGKQMWLNITGSSVEGAVLTLKNETGTGLAGGKATPATGGSWNATLPGSTDANGKLFALITPGFTKIKMAVNQSGQEQTTAQLNTSGYTFQTATATINVKNAAGAGLAGVVIDQGGGTWVSGIATTDASGVAKVPMFAGGAMFRANYNKTAQQISLAVPSTFVFQTGAVHSDAGTCTQWATGSWNTFTQDMEVFPGTYKFVFSDFAATFYPISAGTVNHVH